VKRNNRDLLSNLWNFTRRQPYIFALVLLLTAIVINYFLQPNFFRPRILESNLRTYLTLIFLTVAQTIVILGGGIDLSVGGIVSLVNVVIVTALGTEPGAGQIALALALGLLAGTAAGLLNGIAVAYLRFQPIVTTFASAYVFAGLALLIMQSPGGVVPVQFSEVYRSRPLGVGFPIWVIAIILIVWGWARSTRFGRYLFSAGGNPISAYVTGVPVPFIKMLTYVLSGFVSALAALMLVMTINSGDPLIGGVTAYGPSITLNSIVAVVIGGTALSGGQGSMAGSIIGALFLSLLLSIISFANVDNWWQVFVNGIIIVLALAVPGLVQLMRGRRS